MNFLAKIILLILFNRYGDYTRKPELLDDRPWYRIQWHIKRQIKCIKNIPYALKCLRTAPKGKKLMTFRWAMGI